MFNYSRAVLVQLAKIHTCQRNAFCLSVYSKSIHKYRIRQLSTSEIIKQSNVVSGKVVDLEILSGLTYLQLKSFAKSVGLPANQKKDKLLKLLKSHFSYCPSDIPETFESDITAQLKKNQDVKLEASQISFIERDFDEEHEAEMLANTVYKFQPDVDEGQLDYALTYPGLQAMGRAIGLKSNSKRVILLKQINAYCDCMLDHNTLEGGLKDLVLPHKGDQNHRRPPSPSGRPRNFEKKPPKPLKAPIDPELAEFHAITLAKLRETAKKMKLNVGPTNKKHEVMEALRERRRREMAGEVFQFGASGRILSPAEVIEQAEEKLLRAPKIEYFGKFLRTKHLKGAVADGDGTYSPERVLTVVEHLQNRGTIPREVVLGILRDARKQHLTMPNVLSLSRPRLMDGTVGSFTVCGDLLGDLENLLHIFSDRVGGFPSSQNPFVFTGDLVDKGAQSVELLLSLLLLKLSAPDSVHLLRGTHETSLMNSKFGFEEQILRLYDSEMLTEFRSVLNALPVAAVLDQRVFVVHGGVGRTTSHMTIEQMNSLLHRDEEPQSSGALAELLWADPQDSVMGLSQRHSRNGGYSFGADITSQFLQLNGLELMVRSRECVSLGFETLHDERCVTVFSVPMHYGEDSEFPNLGALVRFDQRGGGMAPRYIQFDTLASSQEEEDLDFQAGAV